MALTPLILSAPPHPFLASSTLYNLLQFNKFPGSGHARTFGHLLYDYRKIWQGVCGLRFSLTCCQRWLSILVGQQQQQNFNDYNDKNALIVKQKHCNLCLEFWISHDVLRFPVTALISASAFASSLCYYYYYIIIFIMLFFMLSLSAFCSHTHTHLIVYVRAYAAFLLTGIYNKRIKMS